MLSANRLPMTMGCIPKCKRGELWWRPVGRHINAALRPLPLVADTTTFMGAWQWYQSEFMAVTKRKPYNRASPGENKPTALTGDGNAPLLPPAAASPPKGEILAALNFMILMTVLFLCGFILSPE